MTIDEIVTGEGLDFLSLAVVVHWSFSTLLTYQGPRKNLIMPRPRTLVVQTCAKIMILARVAVCGPPSHAPLEP